MPQPLTRPVRVLLVDARPDERLLSKRMLQCDVPRVAVREVGDVAALAAALAEEAPRVAVVEHDLGWADGLSLLAPFTRRWPACRTVLFTSQSLDRLAGGGTALRCDAALRKGPAGWTALGATVLDLIAESREPALAVRGVGGDGLAGAAPAPEAGAHTLDWFPEVEESEAEEEARAAATRDGGAVHQLLPAVNLESLVLTAMSQLRAPLRASRAKVRAGALPTLRLERSDGLTLLRNLIANAIEHAGPRPPVVTVRAERRGAYWLLSVHDSGTGIDVRDVGEALHLIHPPGRRDDDGGGLVTCRSVARRYGGDVWVAPRPGGGTSVYVALCTVACDDVEDVQVTVHFQGREMGRIGVTTLSNKQQIAGRALELPRLRAALDQRSIKDVVFVDADAVKIVA